LRQSKGHIYEDSNSIGHISQNATHDQHSRKTSCHKIRRISRFITIFSKMKELSKANMERLIEQHHRQNILKRAIFLPNDGCYLHQDGVLANISVVSYYDSSTNGKNRDRSDSLTTTGTNSSYSDDEAKLITPTALRTNSASSTNSMTVNVQAMSTNSLQYHRASSSAASIGAIKSNISIGNNIHTGSVKVTTSNKTSVKHTGNSRIVKRPIRFPKDKRQSKTRTKKVKYALSLDGYSVKDAEFLPYHLLEEGECTVDDEEYQCTGDDFIELGEILGIKLDNYAEFLPYFPLEEGDFLPHFILKEEWFGYNEKEKYIIDDEKEKCTVDDEEDQCTDDNEEVQCTDKDVLFGRGGKINQNPGNIKFRERAEHNRIEYNSTTSKKIKNRISRELVAEMKKGGARFLKEQNGKYFKVGFDKEVISKASQVLRESPEKGKKKRAELKDRESPEKGKKKGAELKEKKKLSVTK
jgi:hypothetical protein